MIPQPALLTPVLRIQAGALLLALALSGCIDDVPTAPLQETPSDAVLLADGGCSGSDPCDGVPPPPPGEASINLAIPADNHSSNNGGAINWFASTLQIPANHWYYVEVTEAISISSNPEYKAWYCNPPAVCDTELSGTVAGPMGIRSAELKTHVGFQTPDGWYEATLTPLEGEASKARKLIRGPATVWLKRNILYGSGSCYSTPLGSWDIPDCPYPDGGLTYSSAGAYLLSGIHRVRITPVSLSLQVTAQPPSVVAGDSVAFAASSSGGAVTVTEWMYREDEGGLITNPGTCQPPATSCKAMPRKTGTIYVRAQVGSGGIEQASQHVVVQPDSLRLTVSWRKVVKGERPTFTATTEHNKDFTVVSWSWTPVTAPGTTSTSGCGTDKTCAPAVMESGTMTVVGTLRTGEQQSDTASVVADTLLCPTGDPMLDDPSIRRKIIQESGATVSERIERAAVVQVGPGGRGYIPYASSFPSVCQTTVNVPVPGAGDTLEGYLHYHPDTGGVRVFCTYQENGVPKSRWIRSSTGGSEDDWNAMNRWRTDPNYRTRGPNGGPIPFYVVDPQRVFILRPGNRKRSELRAGNNFEWNTDNCRWKDNFE